MTVVGIPFIGGIGCCCDNAGRGPPMLACGVGGKGLGPGGCCWLYCGAVGYRGRITPLGRGTGIPVGSPGPAAGVPYGPFA